MIKWTKDSPELWVGRDPKMHDAVEVRKQEESKSDGESEWCVRFLDGPCEGHHVVGLKRAKCRGARLLYGCLKT